MGRVRNVIHVQAGVTRGHVGVLARDHQPPGVTSEIGGGQSGERERRGQRRGDIGEARAVAGELRGEHGAVDVEGRLRIVRVDAHTAGVDHQRLAVGGAEEIGGGCGARIAGGGPTAARPAARGGNGQGVGIGREGDVRPGGQRHDVFQPIKALDHLAGGAAGGGHGAGCHALGGGGRGGRRGRAGIGRVERVGHRCERLARGQHGEALAAVGAHGDAEPAGVTIENTGSEVERGGEQSVADADAVGGPCRADLRAAGLGVMNRELQIL